MPMKDPEWGDQNVVVVAAKDVTSGEGTALVSVGNALQVATLAGAPYTVKLIAEGAGADLSGATEIWSSASGCNGFEVRIWDAATDFVQGTDWLAVAWGTTDDSGAAVKTVLATAVTQMGTSTGAEMANVVILTQATEVLRITAMGGKIYNVAAVGADDHPYLLTIYA